MNSNDDLEAKNQSPVLSTSTELNLVFYVETENEDYEAKRKIWKTINNAMNNFRSFSKHTGVMEQRFVTKQSFTNDFSKP